MSSLGTEAADYTEACTKCQRVGKLYKSQSNCPNIISLHTTRSSICAGKKSGQLLEKKKKSLDRLGKIVSAWRNSGGGQVLIHVEGQLPEDRCLEQFDEFITRSLTDLIDDGELYVDTYRRQWLSDIQKFRDYTNFVFVNVKKTNGLATVDFNTKVRNDIENVSVTSANLGKCMLKRRKNTVSPTTRGLYENTQLLHECRHIEIKALHVDRLKSAVATKLLRSPSDFVDYIWYDLKLKDNLTSMSKIEGGGSYYVGISENILDIESCRTKILNIDGFSIKFEESEITSAIESKLQSDTIALYGNNFCDVPVNLIEVRLHPINGTDRRVLEVAVRCFDGIIFSDKDGPRAYEVKNNNIHRMDKAVWLERFTAVMT
ncbi:uncharacterized protein [Haliotis asinina]|uniref:uncharacterized protein n=1 Tax=Haliotis asinina TaxID=109174 RepID=UPI003531B72D